MNSLWYIAILEKKKYINHCSVIQNTLLTLAVVVFKFLHNHKDFIVKGLNNLGLNLLREWLLTNH